MSHLIEPEPVRAHRDVELQAVQPNIQPGPIGPEDVVQGDIHGCAIAAVMVATARARPQVIRSLLSTRLSVPMFSKRRGDNNVPRWSTHSWRIRFRNRAAVLVTPLFYFRRNRVAYARKPNGAGWPSLIEKAYAIDRGGRSYNALDLRYAREPPPTAQTILRDFVGPSDMADIANQHFYPRGGPRRDLTDHDIEQMARRSTLRPTIAASLEQTRNQIVANHGYAVMGWRGSNVVLRDPLPRNGETALTIAHLRTSFQAILQAH